MKRKPLNPLVLVPGALFWALLIAGFVTHNDTLLGVATTVAVASIVTVVTFKLRAGAAEKTERGRIWRKGKKGTARVVSIGTNGGGLNDHPMVDLELDVTVDGKPPYRVSVRALISQLAIPRIQPECQISVRVDAGDPSKLVVDAQLTPYGYD